MGSKMKNFFHGVFAFSVLMSILAGFLVLNGLHYGGAF
jgi:hypothetical protein